MSVARIPHVGPLMGADCRPKKPLAIFAGSDGPWQIEAMRQLHTAFGAILRTDTARNDPELYLETLLDVMQAADVLVVWVDGPCWLGPELGMALAGGIDLVVGTDPGAPFDMAGHVRYLMTRARRPVHDTLEAVIAAARAAGQARR